MSSSSFVPRTARDLLVPPTPAGSHDRPRGPLTLRLPPLSSFAVVSKPSPTKPARRKGSTASRKRKRDDFDDDLDLLGPGSTITYSAPKKPARRKPLNELLPGLISRIKKYASWSLCDCSADRPGLQEGFLYILFKACGPSIGSWLCRRRQDPDGFWHHVSQSRAGQVQDNGRLQGAQLNQEYSNEN